MTSRCRRREHVRIGAFNLVRASAYHQCAGYEALRLTVVDDMKLGLLLRRAGKRTRVFIGGDDAECHWGTTLRSMVKIVEKNFFAAMDFRLGPVLAVGLGGMLLMGLAIAGPLTGTVAGMAAGLAPLSLILPASVFAHRLGWSWYSAVLTPFLYPALLSALLNSTWVTLRQGGIRWRDTFYALDTLRAGNVR